MKVVIISAMWCPACIVMNKVWKNVEQKYKNIEFVKYDYDIDEDVVNQYNPGNNLPITIFIKDEKEISRLNGEQNEDKIITIIEENK